MATHQCSDLNSSNQPAGLKGRKPANLGLSVRGLLDPAKPGPSPGGLGQARLSFFGLAALWLQGDSQILLVAAARLQQKDDARECYPRSACESHRTYTRNGVFYTPYARGHLSPKAYGRYTSASRSASTGGSRLTPRCSGLADPRIKSGHVGPTDRTNLNPKRTFKRIRSNPNHKGYEPKRPHGCGTGRPTELKRNCRTH